MSDLKFALRSLAKSPGFTAIALLTLALGIGLNTSMFSVLNALILRTLPYARPDELVRVYRTNPRSQFLPHSPANFIDLQAHNQSFTHLAAIDYASYNFAQPGQPADRLRGLNVTSDFFALLEEKPAVGRVFGADEDQPGHNAVIVLSHPCWQRRFGSDPGIVGRELRLDGVAVTVIGVMPPRFEDRLLWGTVDGWRPMAWSASDRQNRGGNWLTVIGRLKPDTATGHGTILLESAQADLAAISAQLATAYPASNAQTSVNLMGMARAGQDSTMRTLSFFTMGLAACVLLIACANLANLQFARNAVRAREHAVRAALGASRFQLLRHTLTESLVLAAGGGMLGVLVALWSNDALGSRLALSGGPGLALPLDLRVLGFALGVATLTGVGFGLLPAWLAARADVNDALKQGARGTTGSRAQQRIRHGLIVAEVALALVLLSGAGFFLRGLDRFTARDLGWRTDHVLTASLSLPAYRYPNDDTLRAFYDRLETRLGSLPGVERVSLATAIPFNSFNFSQRFVVEGQVDPKAGAEPQRDVNLVSPGYFDTMSLALVEGRTFQASDITATGPLPTVINETMARQFWPGQSAVGKRIAHPSDRVWQEIIGVVRDVRFATNVAEPSIRFQSYRLLQRDPSRGVRLTVRSTLAPESLADAVRRAVTELDPEQPVQELRTAAQAIEQGMTNLNVVAAMLTGFAALGLLLAAIGIYGVIAGFVVQRTKEIGLRLALGAQLRDILRLVLGQGLRLALLGVVIGLAGAVGVGRLLGMMVPALPGPEFATAAGVTAVLLAAATFACWLPARRATKVDPMVALRAE